MTILVQQLRERALKATPGPWQHERLGIIQGGPMQTYVNGAAMPQLLTSHGADFMSPGEYLANADFVAAANPAAVLALLDELAATESRLHDVAVLAATAEQERDQLKAENAELRRGQAALEAIATMPADQIRESYNKAYYAPREIGSDAEQIRAGMTAVLRKAMTKEQP